MGLGERGCGQGPKWKTAEPKFMQLLKRHREVNECHCHPTFLCPGVAITCPTLPLSWYVLFYELPIIMVPPPYPQVLFESLWSSTGTV